MLSMSGRGQRFESEGRKMVSCSEIGFWGKKWMGWHACVKCGDITGEGLGCGGGDGAGALGADFVGYDGEESRELLEVGLRCRCCFEE